MSGKQQDRGVSKNTNKEAQEGGLGRRIIRPRGWSGQDGFGLTARWMLHFFSLLLSTTVLVIFSFSFFFFCAYIALGALCWGVDFSFPVLHICTPQAASVGTQCAVTHTPLTGWWHDGTIPTWLAQEYFFLFGILWILQFCCPPSVSAQAL